jgi:hypothetical protein
MVVRTSTLPLRRGAPKRGHHTSTWYARPPPANPSWASATQSRTRAGISVSGRRRRGARPRPGALGRNDEATTRRMVRRRAGPVDGSDFAGG